MYKEGQQQAFFKRVHQYVARKTKDEDTKAGTREAIVRILEKSDVFVGVSDAVASRVVEDLAEAPDLDNVFA